MKKSLDYALFGLVGLAILLFFLNIWGYDLWPPDEPRFGEVAREMLQSHNFLAPHINGEPYKEKPPLLFWAICAVAAPLGDVTEFSARFPSALAAFLSVICVFLLARRQFDARTGFWSGIVLATTVLFWWEARTVHTDMLMVFGLTLSMLALWRWHIERKNAWLLLFYAAIAVALFAKGPPALAFPLLAIVTFYWKRRADRQKTHWLLGLAGATALVLLWYIPARLSLPHAAPGAADPSEGGVLAELYRQIIGRAVLGSSKAQPPWYYIENLPWIIFPWVLFLPWTAIWCWKRWKVSDETRYLLCWTVPAFIFFSIVVGKRPYYLLPIFPALSIVFARSILDLVDDKRDAWIKSVACVWAGILGLLAVAPLALRYTEYRDVSLSSVTIIQVFIAGFALNTLFMVFWKKSRAIHMLIATQFGGLLVLAALVFFPMVNPFKSARTICAPLNELSQEKVGYDLYSVAMSREEYIFYARHFHEAVLTDALDLPQGLSAKEARKAEELQYKTRRAIMKAVEQVSIASFASVTPQEIQDLNAHLEGAVKFMQLDAQHADAFESALRKEVNAFAEKFEQAKPAFMFVQEQDWRWILPLRPEMRAYPVIGNQPVGSRDMLLIANDAGAKAVGERK